MALLRLALGLIAAFAVLTSTLGALVIWGAFEVRQEHIAEHLCESPDSDCDGMCFLNKKMESHHGHDEPAHTPKAVVTAPTLIAVAPPASAVPEDAWREPSSPTGRTGLEDDSGALEDVFHPPRRG
ncbi:hypothetical protein [Rubrivirga sp.]|uniref:hypothetical protein n=1 Tax=Rubrivirga sp. TaxID=1885344 RepID=UPI003C72686A